jgi:hypothetical protein
VIAHGEAELDRRVKTLETKEAREAKKEEVVKQREFKIQEEASVVGMEGTRKLIADLEAVHVAEAWRT